MDNRTYVLGLDIGSNSIGWALLQDPISPGENNLIDCGVRVFPAGTNNQKPGSETSKTGDRRTARGMRRQIERRSRRKLKLQNALLRHKLVQSPAQIQNLYTKDPYELRSRGLDSSLTPEEFARALLHLSQKRGFKSNRRSEQSSDSKIVGKGIKQFEENMEKCTCPTGQKCRTVGQYFYRHVPLNSDRRRNRKATESSETRFYFDRKMVRDEFDALWARQMQTHPEILTEKAHTDIVEAIFWQRPFDKNSEEKIGRCGLEKSKPRARKGHRLAHSFRILTELQNIRVESIHPATGRTVSSRLTPEQLNTVREHLENKDKLKLAALPGLLGLSNVEINLSRGEREEIKGNSTEKTLKKAFGSKWTQLSEEDKNAICEYLLEEEENDAVCQWAQTAWKLDSAAIETLLKNPLGPQKHGRFSKEALQKLIPFLEAGTDLDQAITKCYPDSEKQDKPYDLLPFPPGTFFYSENSKKQRSLEEDARVRAGAAKAVEKRLLLPDNYQPITNPVVKKALYETRTVVNKIIQQYGKPARIRVELARETKGSIDERNDRAKDNAKRRKEKEALIKEIKEILSTHCGTHREPTGGDILKYRLYRECAGVSAYSGRPISKVDLFTGSVHVDHIIPFSRSLDDSFANKVLCFHDENDDKGNQTPYEWLHHNPQRYHEVLERIRRFNCVDKRTWIGKKRRFEQTSVGELDEFIARKLTDTQYIARQVHEYLQCLYPKGPGEKTYVQVGRGQTTAALRHLWGLDSILWELNEIPYEEQSIEKNRTDHRHHAIDAIVVALTTPGVLQQFSRRQELQNRNSNGKRTDYPTPWAQKSAFRNHIKEAIAGIVVSHASTRRIRGALHQETLYGKTESYGTYSIYKPVVGLTKSQIECIKDNRVRKLLRGILDEAGLDWNSATDREVQSTIKANQDKLRFPMRQGSQLPCPIRRVKIELKISKPIEVKRSGGENAYVAPGSNHHVEIFQWQENGKLVRDIISVSRFEAARRIRFGLPVVIGQHPTRPEAELLMSLCNNDVVELRYRGGPPELCRLQKQSVTDGINRNKPDLGFRVLTSTATDTTKTSPGWRRVRKLAPDQFEAVKVEVNALGEIISRNIK